MELPDHVMHNVREYIPRDRERSSPTAKIIKEMVEEAERRLITELIHMSNMKINEFRVSVDRGDSCNIVLGLELKGVRLDEGLRHQLMMD